MPPHTSGNGATAIDMFHEERLQRVEEDLKSVSKHDVQIEYLNKKFDELGNQLTERLEAAIKPVLTMGETQSKQIEKMSTKLSHIDTRIEVLERDKAARSKVWGVIRKVVMGAILAGAGAYGTWIVQRLLA